MTTCTIWVTCKSSLVFGRNYSVVIFFFLSKYLCFKETGLTNFADIKITMQISISLYNQNRKFLVQKFRCQQNSRNMSRSLDISWISFNLARNPILNRFNANYAYKNNDGSKSLSHFELKNWNIEPQDIRSPNSLYQFIS